DIKMDVPQADSRSVRCGQLPSRGHRESRGQKENRRDRRFHHRDCTRNGEQKGRSATDCCCDVAFPHEKGDCQLEIGSIVIKPSVQPTAWKGSIRRRSAARLKRSTAQQDGQQSETVNRLRCEEVAQNRSRRPTR